MWEATCDQEEVAIGNGNPSAEADLDIGPPKNKTWGI